MRTKPTWAIPYIVIATSGWIGYAFVQHLALLIIASILTLIVLPRFFRGSRANAQAEIMARLKRGSRKPNRRIQKHLAPEEANDSVMELHESPIKLILWWLFAIIWTGGLGTLAYVWNWQWAAIIWGAGMVPMLIRVWLWRRDKMAVTTKRIFIVEGIISFRVSDMPLEQITDAKQIEPWHSRLLYGLGWIESPYGRLQMETGGQDKKFHRSTFMPCVNAVKLIILERTYGDAVGGGGQEDAA